MSRNPAKGLRETQSLSMAAPEVARLGGSWEESGKEGRVGLESKKEEKTSNAE